jgi:hypothetical protein
MSTMQRRHFIAIAAIIRDHGTSELAEAFANYLASSNPLFDRKRFLDMCEPVLTLAERRAIVKKIEEE